MGNSPLASLSMPKYTRLLPRVFAGSELLELRSMQGDLIWSWPERSGEQEETNELMAWADFGHSIGRRTLSDGRAQFRCALMAREKGEIGWLVVGYDTSISVPMDTAPEPMRRAFTDVISFMQEEIALQSECDQLALELTERYEELNLVYTTDDRIEHLEEGQRALNQLVHNCTDYLDVGMAALICRERSLEIVELNRTEAPADPDRLLELLRAGIYNRVEAQVMPFVLNELDKEDRHRFLDDLDENLIAYPVIDDYGTAIGVLAVVARQDLHTFSNGDRNLLEVMAKKASRIIHTHHDALTGLINRSGFESVLVATLNNTRSNNAEHCILHIDIDQLHVVNDLMGYEEGDALIRRVSRAMSKRLRDTDCLARLGGDEFGVLLTNCSLDKAYDIATDVSSAIRKIELISANRQLDVTASIGVAQMTRETDGIVGLLASAEIACKAAKENSRDGIQVYEEDNTTLVRRSEEIEWLGRVQTALRDDAFELYCQPVVPILDRSRAGHFEILLRMIGDDGEVLSPAKFMPAAERYQMMPMVDRWVIRNSLRLLAKKWQEIEAQKPVFCINLSGQSLTNTGFYSFIKDELAASRIPPSNICFEITETAAISNIDDAIALMRALRGAGCRFSLDDFGAGLSSFGYLKKLPVDYLKIDGSFIREITTDAVSLSMVEAIASIGQSMGLSIVAEFVSDDSTVSLLQKIGVDFAQGFGVGKPAPIKDSIRALKNARESKSA
jgi:diguanylate cyclase (GGDEF)-like protein